ncbi:RNA chaperone Hfq [Hydrogenobacter sp. T-2]|uniref:RNA chaperone Hfq n=1 Tax=Pampinifervens diazotrophicum TaxID=1632018 RepID=UPI002B259811|nr:RNA chaperone Hfq [Hydrogenobacter sp. T-2]WPM31969.1 RNA chaperone Hfq [Hydrogenobacter sp. T-2]
MAYKLQEAFLNTARKRRVKVTIYLVNGVRLQGRIRSFDLYTILIEDGRQQTLVYKHAITTIIPAERMEIEFEEEGVPGAV